MKRRRTVFLFALVTSLAAAHPTVFNVRDFGATGDGVTIETAAFARAVAAASSAGGGTVLVPPGRYLSGTIELKSHITLEVAGGATILGSEHPDDYPATPDVWGEEKEVIAPLIYAVDADNITLTGRGTIDGQGRIWWKRLELAHPNPKRGWRPPATSAERAEVKNVSRGRPRLIRLVRCRDVLIENLNLRNAADWTVHPLLCEFVRVERVAIFGEKGSHNTDGIDPEACRQVVIAGCRIDTGDDCVTLKSGRDAFGRRMGRPTENVTISDCVMYRGHGGVTIGSEMSGGVRNVTVTNCVFQGTDTGIRIKSQRGRGGMVEGVTVSNIVMQDVATPFLITTFYAGGDQPEDVRPVDEGTPRYRDFHFASITARGAKIAGAITGLREMPVGDFTFTDVQIAAQSAFTITNAADVVFRGVRIDTAQGPALVAHNSERINTEGLTRGSPHAGVPLIVDDGKQ